MKFTRLRLLGFKSFVEAADFVIEPGLTAVVGPNGCGKSNLVEALRWVMGESSYKSMRASGMDDVIFSGSATRPARNTAEVTLFLDNADRTAPAAFNDGDELQVSRRISRAEGSVYRINGREARARDVQLLFADQSTGARSPSMVGQGRVAELIGAKPQARRALLEEAAGISGLHSRRHEAEIRLRAAEANLDRLDDVVGELEKQIESLKRQVRGAERFKSLSAEMRQAEAALLHISWREAVEGENAVRTELNAATLLVAERANAQIEAAKAQAVNLHGLPPLREAEAEAAAALVRLGGEKAQVEAEAGRLRERQSELRRMLDQVDADRAREERAKDDGGAVLRRLEDEAQRLAAQDASTAGRLAQADKAVAEADARLSVAEGALALLMAENAQTVAARRAAEREANDSAERLRRERSSLAAIEREAAEIRSRLDRLPDLDANRGALAFAERSAGEAEAAIATAEQRLAAARTSQAAAQAPLGEARTALARVEGEVRALQKMMEASTARGRFVPVAEHIAVTRGYEKALAAALGSDLEAPLDEAAPIHWAGAASAADEPALPPGVPSLAEFVQAPPALARRLAQVGVADSADLERLRLALRPGQRLVTREGALWRWDGLTAGADAPSAAAERLARRNRLTELQTEAETVRDRLSDAQAEARSAEAETLAAGDAEKRTRTAWREAQTAVGTARGDLKRAEEAGSELLLRRAALDEAQRRAVDACNEAEGRAAEAAGRLASSPDLARLKRRLDEETSRGANLRKAQFEARSLRDRIVRDGEARALRLEAIVGEREAWTARAADADRQIDALRTRAAAVDAELSALAEKPDEIEQRRRQLLSSLSDAESARCLAADRLAEAEARQREMDDRAAKAIHALSQSREARVRSEERLNAFEARRAAAEARIRETLGVEPHLASRQAGLDPVQALPAEAEIERRLERLRSERDRLGAVNLRAEEEARELAERLSTIVGERGDVIEAVKALRGAIASLNREGRDRLSTAFGAVNAHFQALFTHLFGGGTAELQLVEAADPLEAGIEIVARPPGKKPQTMTLLSGGEQALTALSLIFAVFLTNPAPICVLDEVDAPLDDHNVERFCNLLDRMVRMTETRFLVITHNPITMARMNRLFGVTMAEQGVSQLVSVDLQGAEKLREAG